MKNKTLSKKCPAALCVMLLALAAVFGMTFAAWGAGSTDATGFLEKNGVWYYYDENGGTVKQDIVQDPSGKVYNTGRDTWWYVEDSVVRNDFTGVEQNSYGWWYVKNGAVDFSHNGVEQNDYGWWYIVGGKVQFSYTGVANYSNPQGWWYIKDGKVDFSKNSVEQNDYGWWYVKNGAVDFSYNGIAKNAYGWWYINNGKVNFNHSVDVNQDFADKVLELTNKERSQNGYSSVNETEKAREAAITRAGELSFNFSHVRPDGSSWDTVLADYNISYSSAGENAALGQNSTDEVWEDWMDSPGHKSNILNSNYTNVGVGCVKIDGIYYWDMLLFS